nr:MAG TPA: Pyroglutamyl peptidase [Caudoviricetes sp.]
MVESETLCNTLFYETLSKLKKGCFGLRLKAVFVFL